MCFADLLTTSRISRFGGPLINIRKLLYDESFTIIKSGYTNVVSDKRRLDFNPAATSGIISTMPRVMILDV
jgi:hypothetical protein